MLNNWILRGRTTRDVEHKVVGNTTKASFSIAHDATFGGETEYYKCEAWGKTADKMRDKVGKGSMISMVGNAKKNIYEGKNGKVDQVIFNANLVHYDDIKKPNAAPDNNTAVNSDKPWNKGGAAKNTTPQQQAEIQKRLKALDDSTEKPVVQKQENDSVMIDVTNDDLPW